ncbi:hypothetical protein AWB75_00661 [Caballeronia catudaia]|uniref:Haloacid dehalogenase-like hydrolase n=2 Tax=Caballeronia catudaia TaxID=1777136 RepID=A0A157ZGX1_9BURK|nr:hypothetical protein AWB75_00661 [Caballeronia catudaia]
MAEAGVPLCVDLDGTLTATDLLVESFLVLVKRNPIYALLCIGWLLRGKAYLKAQIAQRVAIDVSVLPYNARFVDYLREQRSTGRDLYLCTASNQHVAEQVATHFGFFKGVLASDEAHNLSGNNKAGALTEQFGLHGFDYCGNARADVPYWVSRLWMLAFRGKMTDDPIAYAIKNRLSLFVISLCVATVAAAI